LFVPKEIYLLSDSQVPGTVALTFDDGPYHYTSHILDLFDKYKAKATFFITGNNLGKGEIDDSTKPWPDLIKRMYNAGHQIGSHTWSHQDLSAITDDQRMNQMIYNEMALRNILGFFPTYMRPPYSSCTPACQIILANLGYHVIYFDLSTEDYMFPNNAAVPKSYFIGNLSTTINPKVHDWLVISHDIQQATSTTLAEYMLQTVLFAGFKPVTVGDCLGDPKANWYRNSGGALHTPTENPSGPSSTSGVAKPKTTASEDGKSSSSKSSPSLASHTPTRANSQTN
jgi:peptidoglycan/xylan/chitin deacetylase (PgdA/CDA1 family)